MIEYRFEAYRSWCVFAAGVELCSAWNPVGVGIAVV